MIRLRYGRVSLTLVVPQKTPQTRWFFYFTAGVVEWVAREGFSDEIWNCLIKNKATKRKEDIRIYDVQFRLLNWNSLRRL